jgi:hypothetical protein
MLFLLVNRSMFRAEPAPPAEPAPLVAVAPPDSRKRPASGEPAAEHKPAKASRRSLAVPIVSIAAARVEKKMFFFLNIPFRLFLSLGP